MEASFNFHDAHINKIDTVKDEISILFDKSWGSQIKLKFKGDIDYQINADEANDNYWYDLSVFFRDNYVTKKILIFIKVMAFRHFLEVRNYIIV